MAQSGCWKSQTSWSRCVALRCPLAEVTCLEALCLGSCSPMPSRLILSLQAGLAWPSNPVKTDRREATPLAGCPLLSVEAPESSLLISARVSPAWPGTAASLHYPVTTLGRACTTPTRLEPSRCPTPVVELAPGPRSTTPTRSSRRQTKSTAAAWLAASARRVSLQYGLHKLTQSARRTPCATAALPDSIPFFNLQVWPGRRTSTWPSWRVCVSSGRCGHPGPQNSTRGTSSNPAQYCSCVPCLAYWEGDRLLPPVPRNILGRKTGGRFGVPAMPPCDQRGRWPNSEEQAFIACRQHNGAGFAAPADPQQVAGVVDNGRVLTQRLAARRGSGARSPSTLCRRGRPPRSPATRRSTSSARRMASASAARRCSTCRSPTRCAARAGLAERWRTVWPSGC